MRNCARAHVKEKEKREDDPGLAVVSDAASEPRKVVLAPQIERFSFFFSAWQRDVGFVFDASE